MVRLLLEVGANPFVKDVTGRNAQDIATYMKSDQVIPILQEYMLKPDNLIKQINLLTNELLEEKKSKEILRLSFLNDTFKIEEKDLEFKVNLKKRNCLFIEDKKTAQILGGIISIQELEKTIDDMGFNDIIEVKNTLNCLDFIINEWKKEAIQFDSLEKDIFYYHLKVTNEKSFYDAVYLNYQKFESLEEQVDQEFLIIKKKEKVKPSEYVEIYKRVILQKINDWKSKNENDEFMINIMDFIQDKNSIIQEKRKKFEWKMAPIWNGRRETLKKLLEIKKSTFSGLMITE